MEKKIWTGLIFLMICLITVSCGPSPEELAATSAAQTAAAATNTPSPTSTPLPTPTPTPIPYDLSFLITGEEESLIVNASVELVEVEGDAGVQQSDQAGQVIFTDLPGETVSLSINAQGYFPQQTIQSLERGENQVEISLERDPHGLLPAQACGPGQNLLYIEDFQDGKLQEWSSQIKSKAMGWEIIPHPDAQGNLVLVNNGKSESGGELLDTSFEDAVWHVQFMKDGNQINAFEWHAMSGYTDETGYVGHSAYWVAFETPPDWVAIHRIKDPGEIPLFSKEYFIEKNTWHQVDMSTFEGMVELWLNGNVLVSFEDPEPLPGGTINIGIYGIQGPEQTIYFDNLVVCELTEPYQPYETTE